MLESGGAWCGGDAGALDALERCAVQLLDAIREADADELFGCLARSHAGLLSPGIRAQANRQPPAPPVGGLPVPARGAPHAIACIEPRLSLRLWLFFIGEESVLSASSLAKCDAVEEKHVAPPAAPAFVFMAASRPPAPIVLERAALAQALTPLFEDLKTSRKCNPKC